MSGKTRDEATKNEQGSENGNSVLIIFTLTAPNKLEEALFQDQLTRGYLGEAFKCTVLSTQPYSQEVCCMYGTDVLFTIAL